MYPEPVPVVTGIESLGYPLVTFVRPFKVFLHVRFYKEHDFKGFVASAFRYRHVNFTILDNPSAYIEPQVFICVGIVKLNLRKYLRELLNKLRNAVPSRIKPKDVRFFKILVIGIPFCAPSGNRPLVPSRITVFFQIAQNTMKTKKWEIS